MANFSEKRPTSGVFSEDGGLTWRECSADELRSTFLVTKGCLLAVKYANGSVELYGFPAEGCVLPSGYRVG